MTMTLQQQLSQQDRQALLKTKHCPQVAAFTSTASNTVAPSSDLHPGQVVQAVSCTQETHGKST